MWQVRQAASNFHNAFYHAALTTRFLHLWPDDVVVVCGGHQVKFITGVPRSLKDEFGPSPITSSNDSSSGLLTIVKSLPPLHDRVLAVKVVVSDDKLQISSLSRPCDVIAVGLARGEVQLWDWQSSTLLGKYRPNTYCLQTCLAFHVRESHLWVGCGDAMGEVRRGSIPLTMPTTMGFKALRLVIDVYRCTYGKWIRRLPPLLLLPYKPIPAVSPDWSSLIILLERFSPCLRMEQ